VDGRLEQLLQLPPAPVVRGEEDAADPVGPGLVPEEPVGELEEDPGAVAGLRVGAGGAAVLEVREGAQRAADRLVRGAGVEAGDEGDAARVVLVGRVVEPLSRASRRGAGAG
jgi:hypothetical protein